MLSVEKSAGRRTVEVWIVLQLPAELEPLPKDLTLSVHSQSDRQGSHEARVPWANAIRLVGIEDIFVVRIKIPVNVPCYLHAVALIEEAPKLARAPFRRRHIGMRNVALDASAGDSDLLVMVTHFETYTLYQTAFKNAA